MDSIINHFKMVITGLRATIANHTTRDRPRAALFTHLWTRVGRAAQRFEALYNKWQAGTLPSRRNAPPPVLTGGLAREADQGKGGTPQTPNQPPTAKKPYIPQGHAWLVAAVGYQAVNYASQLQHMLARPDCAEFLAAVPRTGRILRPLCRLLGIPVPEPIRLPPRPARPRPPKPPRPPRPAKIPLWQCFPMGFRPPYLHLHPRMRRRKNSPA